MLSGIYSEGTRGYFLIMTVGKAIDQDLRTAVMRMTDEVGDTVLCDYRFEPESEGYKDILDTTWTKLNKLGWVRYQSGDYNLTVDGWTQGIIWLERHKDSEFGLDKLMQVLKTRVGDRRQYELYLLLDEAVTLTGLPEQRIRNILEGKLIEQAYQRIGARLDADNTITIPNDFGHRW